jgi:Holliday junction DNA helicase RuvB
MPPTPTQSNVSAASPRTIDHVVGQRQAVELLKTALAAYWNDRAAGRSPDFGSVLMVGPPGTGKTLCASLLAAELGGQLTESLGQTLGMGEDLYGLLMGLEDDGVLFIDEAHLCPAFAQTVLFRAIEERKLQVPKGPLSKNYTSVPLANFTSVIATTDEHGLLAPLRDRMKLTLRFDYYSVEDLAELCRQRAAALHWDMEPEVFLLIAARSKGTPRLAVRLLEGSYRTSRAEAADMITAAHFRRATQLEGIDGRGLDKTEQAYLRMLGSANGRPLRLNVIASILGLPAKTIAEVTESFLLRDGLILRADNGRMLTEKGAAYVCEHLPPE